MHLVTIDDKARMTTMAKMPYGSFGITSAGYIYYRDAAGAICLNDPSKSYTGSAGDLSSCCDSRHELTLVPAGTVIKIVVEGR